MEMPLESRAVDDELISLLDSSRVAYAAINTKSEVLRWSPGMESILGWTKEEATGKSLKKFLPSEVLDKKLKEGESTHFDFGCQTKDKRPVDLNIWLTDFNGEEQNGRLLLMVDNTEKRFLERAVLAAAEREQRRIGQELHDHLCQQLLGAAFSAKALAGELEREQSPHADELQELARLINDAVSQVRDISRGLHPVELDSGGLMSALQELASRVSRSMACEFHCPKTVPVESAANSLHAYRIAQEVVGDALHRKGTTRIAISLSTKKRDSVCLEVADDGEEEGELTADPEGMTAKTLNYRVHAMRGTLSTKFRTGVGTKVTLQFPSKT